LKQTISAMFGNHGDFGNSTSGSDLRSFTIGLTAEVL